MEFTFKYFIFAFHGLAILGLAAYGCHRIWLLFEWFRIGSSQKENRFLNTPPDWSPTVTIQLPLYNERYVAARLIAAAASIEWPNECLEIQVLDDSTDDTRRIVREEVDIWRRKGVRIRALHRANRAGYKAGAMVAGLETAEGEFIAVFDADFLPPPDFLHRIIPHFRRPDIGMVQARWGFLNLRQSWLTRVQAILIGPHFGIEHQVRYEKGLFFNFNGTAGVWRRKAIETAGGWQADTVTEDLDLSYRAQMKGWRFVYLHEVLVPSEMPSTLSAFRTQQQRWAKGSIQTARKILPKLLHSSYPLKIKLEACAHLLANLGWLFGAMVSLLIYPLIVSRFNVGPYQLLRFDLPLMTLAIGSVLFFYCCYALHHQDYAGLVWLPLVPVFSIGIAPSLALAVLQGFFNKGGKFERTPKSGSQGRGRPTALLSRYEQRTLFYLLLNIGLFLYTLLPLYVAWHQETWAAIPLLLFFPTGFLMAVIQETIEICYTRHHPPQGLRSSTKV